MEKTNNKPNRNKTVDGDDKSRRRARPAKKRVCEYCQGHIEHVDYKDAERLKKYTAENGKILPRRASGLCAEHQRDVTTAIKRARIMALLPFRSE